MTAVPVLPAASLIEKFAGSAVPAFVSEFSHAPGTKVVFGPNAVDRAGVFARTLGAQRVLIVTDKGLAEAGWVTTKPKASMYIWAKIPPPYMKLGSLEFAKKLLSEAKVSVSPGIGFGDYGDDHVRFALIENTERTRQAVRGIKEMFKKDGLM